MAVVGIHHVQLAMPPGGEADARRFYADALGLTEIPKPAHLAVRGGCWFSAPGVEIHLGVEPDFRATRKAHPALLVDDIQQMAAAMGGAGVEMLVDQPLEGFERWYVADPFGNRIEIMQRLRRRPAAR